MPQQAGMPQPSGTPQLAGAPQLPGMPQQPGMPALPPGMFEQFLAQQGIHAPPQQPSMQPPLDMSQMQAPGQSMQMPPLNTSQGFPGSLPPLQPMPQFQQGLTPGMVQS